MYAAVFIFLVASTSPFIGIGGLFALRAGLALSLGLKSSWFFTILILVYVGGIIIMFTYITRAIASRKILGVSPRGGAVLVPGVLILVFGYTGAPLRAQLLWPGVNLGVNSLPFIVFLVAYLLLALIRVFILIEKESGPLKMK